MQAVVKSDEPQLQVQMVNRCPQPQACTYIKVYHHQFKMQAVVKSEKPQLQVQMVNGHPQPQVCTYIKVHS